MLRAIGAVTVVGVNDRFGIAVRVELVAQRLKFLAQLKVVVNLAVENYPGGAILVVYWLLTTREVDDRQASHPQADWTVEIEAILVRPTMLDCVAHTRHQHIINFFSVASNDADYSTHSLSEYGANFGGPILTNELLAVQNATTSCKLCTLCFE